MTADDSVKCLCANSSKTSQVGRFQNPGVFLQSVSFLSFPPPPRSFTCAIFRAVFDSRASFFAPKPHGNACYAGYSVSVLTALSKVYEKVLYDQLYNTFCRHLFQNLSGFLKNHSCCTAILKMTEDWRRSLDNRESAMAVAVDLSKAF